MRASGPILLAGYLVVSVLLSESAATATVVDFNGIPDGTPVSAGNPYGGILNLQAVGSVEYLDNGNLTVINQECTINDGVLAAIPPPPPMVPIFFLGNSSILITATFLQPVVDVSFDAWCYRNAGYSYSGFDVNGDPFSGQGIVPGIIDGVPPPPPGPNPFVTFTPMIPAGGHLTSFSISNRDPVTDDAAVWVDNIAFAAVPEPSTAAMLSGGVVVLLIVCGRRAGSPTA